MPVVGDVGERGEGRVWLRILAVKWPLSVKLWGVWGSTFSSPIDRLCILCILSSCVTSGDGVFWLSYFIKRFLALADEERVQSNPSDLFCFV